ncbi:angiopoietin-related protein 3-like [Ambystoma mexicanum]|uniref:angiopoietin-related protein 3-like n=1 Tax=Ambystoma mexicanum TaxID=8296 RepID=UPI0037E85A50
MSRLLVPVLLITGACSLGRCSHNSLASDGSNGDESGLRASPSLDISLLSQSLLQLGLGLKQQADKTKEQMAGFFQQLDRLNSSLSTLVQQVDACERTRASLSRRAAQLEHRDEELQRLSSALQTRLNQVTGHEASLGAKMRSLEERLERSFDCTTGGHLMTMLTSQNLRIKELFTELEAQDGEMNDQEATLEYLVKKVGSRRRKSRCQRRK